MKFFCLYFEDAFFKNRHKIVIEGGQNPPKSSWDSEFLCKMYNSARKKTDFGFSYDDFMTILDRLTL